MAYYPPQGAHRAPTTSPATAAPPRDHTTGCEYAMAYAGSPCSCDVYPAGESLTDALRALGYTHESLPDGERGPGRRRILRGGAEVARLNVVEGWRFVGLVRGGVDPNTALQEVRP